MDSPTGHLRSITDHLREERRSERRAWRRLANDHRIVAEGPLALVIIIIIMRLSNLRGLCFGARERKYDEMCVNKAEK